MSPDQKHFLVERFQELGYCVGFTGDGSNDCGALKNADVGLSLSEAEASVAAPFTSKSTDLSCVLRIIREGRAALVTSFSCFKYMALYSLIQFTSVSLLYHQGNNLGDLQFLYIDIFIIIPIAIFMGRSGPHPNICRKRPTASLMSKYILTSLVGQISLQLIFQAWVFNWIQDQKDWYEPGEKLDDAMFPSMENTALFYISTFQYMTVAFVFNTGAPYRENSIKNSKSSNITKCIVPFMINFLFLWGFTAYMIITENPTLIDALELVSLPFNARIYILGLVLAHFLVSWLCEAWIFKQISKLIDWIRWSVRYYRQRSNMEAADHIDSARWKRRLKWQDRGKIFKLIADDLYISQPDRRIGSVI
jgi:cation-transporting ATPase 13A3/4/5